MMRNANSGLKSNGANGSTSSFQIPNPFSASVFQGNKALGSFLRVGAMSECPIIFWEGIL